MITVEKKIVIFRQYIRYSIKSMRTYLCSIYIETFFVKKLLPTPPLRQKFRGAYGIHFGLKLLLEMSTFKKKWTFSKNQDGSQNKQNRVKKKDGKPSEELHD